MTAGSRLAIAAALTTVGFRASGFVGIRSAGHAFSPGALALAGSRSGASCSAASCSRAASRFHPSAR